MKASEAPNEVDAHTLIRSLSPFWTWVAPTTYSPFNSICERSAGVIVALTLMPFPRLPTTTAVSFGEGIMEHVLGCTVTAVPSSNAPAVMTGGGGFGGGGEGGGGVGGGLSGPTQSQPPGAFELYL